MTPNEMPLWLRPTLCIAGVAVAVGVLLTVHPLRRHFSDAYDFMRTRRLPLGITLAALALQGGGADGGWERAADFFDWTGMWVPLLKASTLDAAVLLHQAIPSLPLAVFLPVWFITLTVRVMRFPYRYQKEKLQPEQRAVLLTMCALTLVWAVVFCLTHGRQGRSEVAVVMAPATLLFGALATAVYQTWLARLVIQWAQPNGEETSARDACFARWQNVLWLGAFNAGWSALRLWVEEDARWLPWSLLVEALFIFAPLPVAVAAERGALGQIGASASRMLWRGALPLAAWAVTAVALLALGRYAVAMSGSFGGNVAFVVRPLVMGMLHAWLLPAAMLLLYRRGFPSQDQPAP